MVIGILQFELLIRGSESLKDKRRVVNSIKDRLHREHLVSIAEVGALNRMDVASMGLACVAIDGARAGEVLDRITVKLRSLIDAELGDTSRQIIHGTGGDGPDPDPPDETGIARELLDAFKRTEGQRP